MSKKILIIYNPAAGKKKKIKKSAEKLLADLDYDWLETSKKIDCLAGVDGNKYDRVVVIGGDGTIHQVANWILKNNYNLILGVVPFGSANLLAGVTKIPKNLGLALRLALLGKHQETDVGLVNKREYFLLAGGLGYDAWVISNTRRVWKRLFGFWSYTIAMLHGLFNLREYNFSLTIDGQREQRHAKTIFIMNFGKFFGLNFGPAVAPDDGYLNIAVVRPVGLFDYFKIFGRLIGRKYYWKKHLEYFRFKKLQINFNKKIPFQLDGEEMEPKRPIEIEVAARALKIVSR